MRLREIWMAKGAIEKLGRADLPAKSSIRILRLIKAWETEFSLIEDQRNKLVRKFGTADPAKETWNVSPEKLPDFEKELWALFEEESKISFEKIPIGMIEELRFSPAELRVLEPFLGE